MKADKLHTFSQSELEKNHTARMVFKGFHGHTDAQCYRRCLEQMTGNEGQHNSETVITLQKDRVSGQSLLNLVWIQDEMAAYFHLWVLHSFKNTELTRQSSQAINALSVKMHLIHLCFVMQLSCSSQQENLGSTHFLFKRRGGEGHA